MPERTVNGDVMLCTDPINAALVEGLPLIKVLSESLKEMTDSVERERNTGVIAADKCPVVLLPESVVGHIGMQHLNRGNRHDAVGIFRAINAEQVLQQILRLGMHKGTGAVRQQLRLS